MLNSSTSCVVISVLAVFLVTVGVCGKASPCSTDLCNCSHTSLVTYDAFCRISNLHLLSGAIKEPANVSSLDVAFSELLEIPDGAFADFKNLVNLSLAHNKIKVIFGGSFAGLKSLRFLDLKMNQLKLWEGNLSAQLPSLTVIDVTGNSHFSLGVNLLQTLPQLRYIRGISWNAICVNCSLAKTDNLTRNYLTKGSESQGCDGVEYSSQKKEFSEFLKIGFTFKCRGHDQTQRCLSSLVNKTNTSRCYVKAKQVLYVEFFLAPLVMLLNATVLLVITMTKSLRENVAMVLASNMALSDFLVGLYSLLVANLVHTVKYSEFISNDKQLCRGISIVWSLGISSSALITFLLTLERYLTVVHSMKPQWRMEYHSTLFSLLICYSTSCLLAFAPFMKKDAFEVTYLCIPLKPNAPQAYTRGYCVAIVLLGFLLYLATTVLYIRIYKVVMKSGHSVGIARERALSRKLAPLVITNMVCFFVPVILAAIWAARFLFKSSNTDVTLSFLSGPLNVILLSINSCVNPVIYVYRQEKFARAIRRILKFVCGRNHAVSPQANPTTFRSNVGIEIHAHRPRFSSRRNALSSHVRFVEPYVGT